MDQVNFVEEYFLVLYKGTRTKNVYKKQSCYNITNYIVNQTQESQNMCVTFEIPQTVIISSSHNVKNT